MVKHFLKYELYDQGFSLFEEDKVITSDKINGVMDAVSPPFSSKHPQIMVHGLTPGERLVRFCESWLTSFWRTIDSRPFEEIIANLSQALRTSQISYGVPEQNFKNAGLLPGATFALARIKDHQFQVAQAGDCMAIIELKNGDIIVSPNQVRRHDTKMQAHIQRIQREIAKEWFSCTLEEVPRDKRDAVYAEMKIRTYPIMLAARQENVNNPKSPDGYGLLNGQEDLSHFIWQCTFSCKEVLRALFVSDGAFPWSLIESTDDETIGRMLLEEFKVNKLAGLLLSARAIERADPLGNYEAEVSGLGFVSKLQS